MPRFKQQPPPSNSEQTKSQHSKRDESDEVAEDEQEAEPTNADYAEAVDGEVVGENETDEEVSNDSTANDEETSEQEEGDIPTEIHKTVSTCEDEDSIFEPTINVPVLRPPDYTDTWGGHAQHQGINLNEEKAMLTAYTKIFNEMAAGHVRVSNSDPPSLAKTFRIWVYNEFKAIVRRMPLVGDLYHEAFLTSIYRRGLEKFRDGELADYSANPKAVKEIQELVDTEYINKAIKGS